MQFNAHLLKKVIESILFVLILGGYFSAHAEKLSDDSYLKELQSNLNKKGITSEIANSKIDLCQSYSLPHDLCTNAIPVQRILHTQKLSMRLYGDVKAKTEKSLESIKFIREEDSVHTYDDGVYFYQCSDFVRKKQKITLHVIGIDEGSIGWYFWSVISSSPCEVSNGHKESSL